MNASEFEQRYRALSPRLMRTALALLGNQADAEDAVQETYLRIWAQSDRILRMEHPDFFIHTALRNLCLNILRGRKRVTEQDIGEAGDVADDVDAELEEQLRADLRLLRLALATLKPKARSAITMFYFDHLSTLDIAMVMGESNGNVRSILSRAREQLRKYFQIHKSE